VIEDSGPEEYLVDGSAAYGREGQCYEVWPVDPKGTPDDGWRLTLATGKDHEEIGVFADYLDAQLHAQQRFDAQPKPEGEESKDHEGGQQM
jgi:hypothetical protein